MLTPKNPCVVFARLEEQVFLEEEILLSYLFVRYISWDYSNTASIQAVLMKQVLNNTHNRPNLDY